MSGAVVGGRGGQSVPHNSVRTIWRSHMISEQIENIRDDLDVRLCPL